MCFSLAFILNNDNRCVSVSKNLVNVFLNSFTNLCLLLICSVLIKSADKLNGDVYCYRLIIFNVFMEPLHVVGRCKHMDLMQKV